MHGVFKMLSLWIEPSALNRSVIVEMVFLLPVSAIRYCLSVPVC